MTGLWEWYDVPDDLVPRDRDRITWGQILERWTFVLADLHQWFGIDLDAEPERPWVVVRARIVGLLSEPRTRLSRDLSAGG